MFKLKEKRFRKSMSYLKEEHDSVDREACLRFRRNVSQIQKEHVSDSGETCLRFSD